MTVFHIFSQQICFLTFLRHAAKSQFFHPRNTLYFITLHFLVHKIFTFYIKVALKFKCLALVLNQHTSATYEIESFSSCLTNGKQGAGLNGIKDCESHNQYRHIDEEKNPFPPKN